MKAKLQEMEATRGTGDRTRKRVSNSDSSSNRIRKPLSDCTNTINSVNPSQSSSTSTKSSTSFVKPSKFLTTNTTTPINDKTSSNPSVVFVNSITTPSPTPKSSSDKGAGSASASREGLGLHSVYSRRISADKTKGKQKAIAEPKSCFPALNTSVTRDEENEGGITSLSKSCVLPCKKRQRRTTSKKDDSEYALPQDFIERQRAYFAEIDAFELPEEEVSINELD